MDSGGHVRSAGAQGGASCAPWWSAFFHARADVAHVAAQPPSCRDYTRVERTCDVERVVRTGRDVLHCRETREQFRICSERVDRLATTSIETREPLLEGNTLLPARSVELVQPLVPQPADSDAAGLPSSASRAVHRDQPSSSGRFYRPFHALADDGSSPSSSTAAAVAAAAGTGGAAPVLTPEVGQAVEDILLFADEMQRDLAHHGLLLQRRGEEEPRRKPGLVARLFGARGWDDAAARGDGTAGSFAGPHSA
ncbi:hypothetical protein PLESTB_001187100 [Pleodorina starrii]|uniref:Uncharacterized protein n=1 Tax=Pleodorina starrii TaxID=330485 RepID=A0A9W6F5L7_9CHLO|nr:hypothetical protein PLESTM_000263200 [Pleodorina starrii]GLC57134.1 hypothetical protein PLESTB_001187100 [Pleodorina starrii]GLC64967.1 hypothetical protein PLESTF_000227200 [Pleodorina starrii]